MIVNVEKTYEANGVLGAVYTANGKRSSVFLGAGVKGKDIKHKVYWRIAKRIHNRWEEVEVEGSSAIKRLAWVPSSKQPDLGYMMIQYKDYGKVYVYGKVPKGDWHFFREKSKAGEFTFTEMRPVLDDAECVMQVEPVTRKVKPKYRRGGN